MKTMVYKSPVCPLAFAPEAMETLLAGRGTPPSCPVYSAAFPGAGTVPMTPQVIDVNEPGMVFLVEEGTVRTANKSGNKWDHELQVNLFAEELKRAFFANETQMREAIKNQVAKK